MNESRKGEMKMENEIRRGTELVQSIRERMERHNASINDRMERINAGLTDMDDCFMSQRVSEQAMHECRLQLNILEHGGVLDFQIVVDENGDEANVREVKTKFGYKVVWNRKDADSVWANNMRALMKKTNLRFKKITAPAWTKFSCGAGGGMCGAYTGNYNVCRSDINYWTGEKVAKPMNDYGFTFGDEFQKSCDDVVAKRRMGNE
jgi:hypothetical protein